MSERSDGRANAIKTREQANKDTEVYSVRVSLQSVLPILDNEALRQTIETAVITVSALCAHASRLANLIVLHHLEKGFYPPPLDVKFYRDCMRAFTTDYEHFMHKRCGREWSDSFKKCVRAMRFTAPVELLDQNHLSYIIAEKAEEMVTYATNHLVLRFEDVLYKHLMGKVKELHPKLKTRERRHGVRAVAWALMRRENTIRFEGWQLALYVNAKHKLKELWNWLPHKVESLHPKIMRDYSHFLLPYYWDFLKERISKGRQVFNLLPVHGVGRTDVPINTNALADLLNHSGEKWNVALAIKRKQDLWKRWMITTCVTPNQSKRFAHSITTNGVAVTLHFRRPTQTGPSQPLVNVDLTHASPGVYLPSEIDFSKDSSHLNVIGVDPGRGNVVTCVGLRAYDVLAVTPGHLRDLQGVRKASHVRKSVSRAWKLVPFQSTFKVKSSKDFLTNWKLYTQEFTEHFLFGSIKKWARQRFEQMSSRKALLHEFATKLKQMAGTSGVIAYGNAGFSGSFGKGNSPGPTKAMLKAVSKQLPVVMIDEAYTSQKCSVCHCQLSPIKHGVHIHRVEGQVADWVEKRHKSTHGVRQCKTEGGCHSTWNRDVNASRNIAWLLEYMYLKGSNDARPRAFQKSFNALVDE